MDAATRFTDEELRFLRELVRRHVDFMVVGLTAAALQGAPVVTQDIDLWFRDISDPRIGEALKSVGGVYIPPDGSNPPLFAGNSALELYDIVLTMSGLGDFDAELKHAVRIPMSNFDILILGLERILASKRALGRRKDKLTIPVLEDTLATLDPKFGS